MLLLYPPMTKACEPSGGLPLLGGVLKSHGIKYTIIDMNYEGTEYLLDNYFIEFPKKEHNRYLIRSKDGYKNYDKYQKILSELTKGINYRCDAETTLTLANFSSTKYDCLKSNDLLNQARNYKDNPFYHYYKERLIPIVERENVKVIGISIQFLNQAVCSFALIGFIKNIFPNIRIVVGGGLITSWVKSPYWDNPFKDFIDKIIIGPGEVELLKYLGVTPDCNKLKISVPDYDYTDEYRYYSAGKIIPISGSIGCSWKKCSFCPEKAEDNPFYAKKSSVIMNEMEYLKERYKPDLIHFLDNEINPSLLKAISKSTNITPWYGFTKFYNDLKSLEFCKQLKEKGCFMLKLGLESGDQNVLNSMNKGIYLDDVEEILFNLKEAKIKTFIYLLFGTPTEDYISALKTKDFVIKHKDKITYLNTAIFNLPINSDIAKEQNTYNFSDADLTLYTGFNHPKSWDRNDIRKFFKNELKASSDIKEMLNRTPLIFNANHAYFFKELTNGK